MSDASNYDALSLTGHQGALQESVEDCFQVAMAGACAAVAPNTCEESDQDPGRLEVRRYWMTGDVGTRPDHPRWMGLRRIGRVERRCLIGTTGTVEQRHCINLIPAEAPRFTAAVRGHWGVVRAFLCRFRFIVGRSPVGSFRRRACRTTGTPCLFSQ